MFEMELNQSAIADFVRIERHLNRLGVTRCSGDHFGIRRVGRGAARVAHPRTHDPRKRIERGLQAPETTTPEDGGHYFLRFLLGDIVGEYDRGRRQRLGHLSEFRIG